MNMFIRCTVLVTFFLTPFLAHPAPQWQDMELLRAMRYGDQASVLRLLESVPDDKINYPISSANDNTLLHLAVLYAGRSKNEGGSAIIEKLLSMGSDINRMNNKGQSPIFQAASLRHASVSLLEFLVANGADINKRDLQGNTPLHFYASTANANFIEKSVALGANVNAANNLGATPLMNAAARNSIESLQALLHSGADIKAADKSMATALHYSAQRGDISVIDFLVTNGLSIDAKTADGKTVLSMLAERQKWPVVRLFLERGANPHVPMRDGPTVAHYIISHPLLDMTKLVDRSKVDINMKPTLGASPLFNALNKVDMEQLELLVGLGVDVNKTHAPNYPAIPFIAEKDPTKHKDAIAMLRRLIELGADIDARKMGWGDTGLAVAVKLGHEEMVDILLQSGAKVDRFVISNMITTKRYNLTSRLLKNAPDLDWSEYSLWHQLNDVVGEIEKAAGSHTAEPLEKFFTALFSHNPNAELRAPDDKIIEEVIQKFENSSSIVVLNAIAKAKFINRTRPHTQAGTSDTHIQQRPTKSTPPPVVTIQKKRTYPSDTHLHVIGVYEGIASDNKGASPWWAKCNNRSPGGLSQKEMLECHAQHTGNRQERQIEIVVTPQKYPVILALMAYDPINWVIKASPDVKIEGVILAGYHGQRVSGVLPNVPVDVYTHEHSECGNCQVGDGYFYTYERNNANFNEAMSRLKDITNISPASFQGRYKGRSFSVTDTN